MIEFISHETFPEDQYTKELCYLQITLGGEKIRIGYVRKTMKNGGLFWGPMSTGLTKNGSKKYFDAVIYDSNFLTKDIMQFLEARSWESGTRKETPCPLYATPPNKPIPAQMSFLDECPF